MFTNESAINSKIDFKRSKSLNLTEERFFSQTTLFIRISLEHNTYTHTHTFRSSFLNEKEKTIHEIDLRREIRVIIFSKTRNIVFNIDSSFKKRSSQTLIFQALKIKNQRFSS
jgi:hypothetical protein